jgi:homoserine kinase
MIRAWAPATTANMGAGFDCAGAALDLWNELRVTEADGQPPRDDLVVRAFACFGPTAGLAFTLSSEIPRERGLGSSAAVVALGLVAGAIAAGVDPEPERLLAAGVHLEGHPDNLAPALAGGVCLTWDGRIARIADKVPATPVVVVPETRVKTALSRSALPERIPHADAAYSVARSALLGASLATGAPDLFAAALDDRLHEPYRSPLLADIRADLPSGALGATLSGSGPSVVVWARPEAAEDCRAALAERFESTRVLLLSVSARGAYGEEGRRARAAGPSQ